jgi:hypothetical protein
MSEILYLETTEEVMLWTELVLNMLNRPGVRDDSDIEAILSDADFIVSQYRYRNRSEDKDSVKAEKESKVSSWYRL